MSTHDFIYKRHKTWKNVVKSSTINIYITQYYLDSVNLSLYKNDVVIEIEKNNKLVICFMALTTLWALTTYVLGNVLYGIVYWTIHDSNFRLVNTRENLLLEFISVSVLQLGHGLEIVQFYLYDKTFRQIIQMK